MSSSGDTLRILVCGGGNGAHTLAGLASSRNNTEVRVLTLFADEAERWTNMMKSNDFVVSVCETDETVTEVKAKPSLVTKDPALAVPGSDVIVLCVPAFAHQGYFEAIAPYVKANCIIAGLPSQAGFEFQCNDVLKTKATSYAIVSFETLPWACRLEEFGKLVQVLGTKESVVASVILGGSKLQQSALETMQFILGDKPVIKPANNYLEGNLIQKSCVHPPLMYCVWKDWNGEPLDHKPLFYQGVDDEQARMLTKVSDEIMLTAQAITQQKPEVKLSEVISIHDWYKQYYTEQVKDTRTLRSCMNTNKAYDGLTHPMIETGDGKFMPNFKYRYLAEDVPFGLVVFRGIAEIAGVPTPAMDEVLLWCQKILGKEYLVGSKLQGKDMCETRAPQRYGLRTLDALLNL